MEPDIAEMEPEEGGEAGSDPQGESAEDTLDDLDPGDDDPDVEQVDLSDDDMATGGSLFSGDEDADDGGSDGADESDGDGDGAEETSDPLGLEGDGDGSMDGLAKAVNEGAARAAVTGLKGDEKSELETEFKETFEAFQLGHFAAEAADEYVFTEDEDVDPIWGLLATAMLCAAFALWTRPDSEEQIGRMKDAVGGMADGIGGAA